jgi:phosphate/sulfate permease
VGLIKGHFLWKNFLKLIPYWLLLPAVAYYLSTFICRQIYPATEKNLWLHQTIIYLEKHWKTFSILTSCYVSFAIGSNNIANIVGPLVAAGAVETKTAQVIFGLFFGLGAIFFFRSVNTVGREIIPLGLVSVSIINGITASLLLGSSLLGIPQSLVQLHCLATIGIACVKNENRYLFASAVVKKIFLVWLVTPLISLGLAMVLAKLFL